MVYLPTFGCFERLNVGKYTIYMYESSSITPSDPKSPPVSFEVIPRNCKAISASSRCCSANSHSWPMKSSDYQVIQAMKWPFDPLWFNTYPTSEHFSKSELRDKQSLRAWICFNSKQYYPKLLFFMVIYPWYAIRLKKSPDKQIQESHLFHAILKSLILFRNIWFGCCNCLPMETYILVGGWTNPFQKNARHIGWFPQGLGWKKKWVATT